MPRCLKRRRQPLRERYVPETSTFRRVGMPLPDRSLDAQLALLQVYISPFQRRDLSTPKAGLPAKEHHEIRLVTPLPSRRHEALDILEVGEKEPTTVASAVAGRQMAAGR